MISAVSMGENRVLAQFGKFSILVDPRDFSTAPQIIIGTASAETIQVIPTINMAKSVCVHVGAMFGHKTLHLADAVGPSGKVYAFEPNPRSFALLRYNLELNEVNRWARAHPNAVGDFDGPAELYIPRRRFSNSTMNARAMTKFGDQIGNGDRAGVICVRLDTVMAKSGDIPGVMFISANGNEPEVISGASVIIAQNKPMTIVLNFKHEFYDDVKGFSEVLFDAGFIISTLDRQTRFSTPESLQKYRGKLLLVR